MTEQRQTHPAASKPRKPRVYHWIPKHSEVTLCGKAMPARQKQLYDPAATHERIVCDLCETLRHMRADLDW